jgi:pyridoxine/pyridoxamine 5'-phosphate oxidase
MTRDQFISFVREARQGVVATVDGDGEPEAALVGLAVTDEAELLFDSLTDARKVRNIRAHPRVALVIGWDHDVSVQVEGRADLLTGAERAACGATYLEQFPGARALDPAFVLVRVVPTWFRYYDARPDTPLVVEGDGW